MSKTRKLGVVAAVSALALGISSMGISAASAKTYKITFIQGVAGDGFYITMGCGIQAEAKKLGAKVKITGAGKWDATLQTPIVAGVIASKPDAILIAPNDVIAMRQPIAAAMKAGIKVVLVDTTLTNASGAVSQISSDNFGGGKAAFNAVKKLVPRGGKTLVISTSPGVSTVDARIAGFKAGIATDSKYTNVGVEYDNDDAAKAAQQTTAAIAANPNLVAIFATNLFSAEGAATGIKQAGKSGKIKVIGFDAGPDQVKALKDGTVQALIAQSPAVIGTMAVIQAVAALKGKKAIAKITTGFTILTLANINTAVGRAATYRSSC
jgi:ribose transport system substrate-binding protein